MGIKIKRRQLVQPCEQTWKGTLPLSLLDQVGIITHSSHIHFFKRPIDEDWFNKDKNKIIETLKESLSLALVSFYPLAGRLRSLSGGRYELECNAKGVELIDASCEMNLSDFGDLYSSSSSDKFRDLLPNMDYLFHGKLKIHDIPLLIVQVTHFTCGSLSFGMSISHVVADGRSAFQFIKEWARLARGEQLGKIDPCHDRSLLLAEGAVARATDPNGEKENCFSTFYSGRNSVLLAEGVVLSTTPDSKTGNYFNELYSGRSVMLAEGVVESATTPDSKTGNYFNELYSGRSVILAEGVVASVTTPDSKTGNYFSELYSSRVEKLEWEMIATPTSVILTKDNIEKLKEVANNCCEGVHGRPFSQFEVITAYMWTCVTMARELKTEKLTTLAFCVDVRGRLKPSLPSSYFGNAIVDVRTTSCVGELLSCPLSYACSKVRGALDEVNDEYVLSTIDYLKTLKSLANYQYFDDRGNIRCPSSSSSPSNDYNVFVLSWLNLWDVEIDFGWGKDVYTGPCVVSGSDGDVMLFPYDNLGSVAVNVCLPSKDKFLKCVNRLVTSQNWLK